MKNKWTLVGFLCALFVVYTVDRALLGLLAQPIQSELGISNTRYGVITAAIFWTYAACVPFSGMAGDRFNRAKLIGWAAIAWSAMTVLAGFAGGFWSLLALAAACICVPQTFFGPSASALIAEHHVETRTIALSFYQAAYYTGWFVSGAAVAGVLKLFGLWKGADYWRGAFFVFGAVGLVLGALFLVWSRSAAKSSAAAPKGDKLPFKKSLAAFFGCPTALLVGTCYVAQVFVGFGYSVWGPKFIAQKFGLTASEAGTGVMFWHFAASFAAILVAGAVTDRFVKRWPRFRLMLSAGAVLIAMPALVAFGTATALPAVWAAASVLGAMLGVIGANQFTALFDVVPSNCRSGSVGFLNVLAGVIGSFAPIALGALSERHGLAGFEPGFASMAAVEALALVALVCAMLFTFRRDRSRVG